MEPYTANFIDFNKAAQSEIKKKSSQRRLAKAVESDKNVKLPAIGAGSCTFLTEPGPVGAQSQKNIALNAAYQDELRGKEKTPHQGAGHDEDEESSLPNLDRLRLNRDTEDSQHS